MTEPAWIRMISDEEADDALNAVFDLAHTPHGTLDNVMRVHSPAPGHDDRSRHALSQRLAQRRQHGAVLVPRDRGKLRQHPQRLRLQPAAPPGNASRLMNDTARSDAVRAALDAHRPEDAFDGKELALLRYAAKLTTDVGAMEKADTDALKDSDCDDGKILEVNQVVACFNYSNRLLNGLGVSTAGDTVGYYKPNTGE